MADYETIVKHEKEKLNSIETVLKKASELIAFIRVYGPLYDDHYNGFILDINNLSEHYLKYLNSEIINNLYNVYSTAKEENKTEEEVFKQLRNILYELPDVYVTEVIDRRKKYK